MNSRGNDLFEKIAMSLVFFFLFLVGMFMIDEGISAALANLGYNASIIGQSLVLKNTNPRVIYHLGVMIAIAAFSCLLLTFIYEKIKTVVENENSSV